MRFLVLLCISIALVLADTMTAIAQAQSGTDNYWDYNNNPPPTAEVKDEGATLAVEKSSASTPSKSNRSEGDSPNIAWTPPPGIPPWVTPVERCLASDDNGYAMECTGAQPAAPSAPGATASTPDTPGVTIRDVATFRPELAALSSEPDGWAVRGLAANFLAAGGSSTRSGTLLGAAAEVRFTPVAWRFDYGDESAPRTTATPGATWQALGLDEFDETATSHVYETSGSFTVSLLVDYAAEYRVGGSGPFVPIPGTLAIPSPSIQMVVADSATTALVGRDCVENPRGPGC